MDNIRGIAFMSTEGPVHQTRPFIFYENSSGPSWDNDTKGIIDGSSSSVHDLSLGGKLSGHNNTHEQTFLMTFVVCRVK